MVQKKNLQQAQNPNPQEVCTLKYHKQKAKLQTYGEAHLEVQN
jgi:hypothetical protein